MGNTWLMLKDVIGINPNITFKGVFDALPERADVGDVVIIFGRTYVYADDWYEVGDTVDNTEIIDNAKEPPKNCPNCGGIINPYKLKCEFCGTYW